MDSHFGHDMTLTCQYEAEADFHVCPKQILTSARAKLESEQDQIGSLLREGGDTSVPNCRSRFPCLPKTDSHFGHDMTLTSQYEAEADFHVCPKRFLTSARAKLESEQDQTAKLSIIMHWRTIP